jgi:pyrroloquinoline quinone biosynthesis protein B
MHIHVLGSAAGGGFPQWNCNCHNCSGLRNGTLNARARTQSSICISADGVNWVLFNTSPDIRTQLAAFAPLLPARSLRDTGICAIVYMDSQIDHTAGLLMLREGCPHEIYCTDSVDDDLTTGFPVFSMLKHWNGGIHRHRLPVEPNSSFIIEAAAGLKFTALPLLSKAPPYSPHRHDPHPGDNVGIQVEDLNNGRKLFYAPGLRQFDDPLTTCMQEADCVLVDGTFWREDEMQQAGVGNKLAAQMGHLPQSGPNGMIERLRPMAKPRKILIHINNTNPILDEESAERAVLDEAGIEVAFDGMDIVL